MSVSEPDVRHIAALARLELDAERIGSLVRELNGILAHMDVLQAVDMSVEMSVDTSVADPIDASAGADGAGQAGQNAGAGLRPDVPASIPLAIERGAFAPNYEDGFFLVPRLATHE